MARKIAELQRGHGVEIGTLKAVFQVGVRPYVTTRRAAWCACVHKLIRVHLKKQKTRQRTTEGRTRRSVFIAVFYSLNLFHTNLHFYYSFYQFLYPYWLFPNVRFLFEIPIRSLAFDKFNKI